MPRAAVPSSAAIRFDVAIRVLDGTQSESTHDPPGPCSSTTVTRAPNCAATRAASYPPGPPPMITTRGALMIYHSCALPKPGLVGSSFVALYAAYGSNMDPAQMALRCPHSPQVGVGWLDGWRLTFGGE